LDSELPNVHTHRTSHQAPTQTLADPSPVYYLLPAFSITGSLS
jgi:hypothetical protein